MIRMQRPLSSSRSSARASSQVPCGTALLMALALGLGLAPAAAAVPISGNYSSPLGYLKLSEGDDGTVTGTITSKKNACNFPVGTKVLDGARLDDSCVAGTFTACRIVSDECFAGPVKGDAILLVTKGGSLLSGAVHLESKGCKTPMTGDAVVLKKRGSKPAPKATPKPKVGEAKKLAEAAQAMIGNGEAEEARKKCQDAVKIDPGFSQGYTCIGITYYLRERYDEAFEYYAKALEANPANRDVYYNMACIYAIQNKVPEALQYLKLSVLNGYIDLQTLNTDNDLKNLHGNPDFEKLKKGEL